MKPPILAVFLLLSVSLTAQVKKIDRATNNLIGPVKSTTVVYYRGVEKFGELLKGYKEFTKTEEYNKEGFLTSSKLVDGSSVTKTTYKYDNAGNLTEKKEDEDGSVSIIKILYNADGKEAEVNAYNNKGALETKLKKKYNEHGLPVAASLYHGDGSLKEKETFIYNDKQQLVESNTYDPEGKLLHGITIEYDNQGRRSTELKTDRDSDDKLWTTGAEYTYDSKGRVIQKRKVLTTGKTETDLTEYDAFGNITKDYTNDKNYQEDVFTYDSRNNWIKLLRSWHFLGSVRKYIIERSVSYY